MMKTLVIFLIMQLGILNLSAPPAKGVKVYLENAASDELVAFSLIGGSGEFEFSNLDPGNYLLSIEVPEHAVRWVDKKQKNKFESEIVVGFNTDDDSWCWKRSDGFLELDLKRTQKIAESLMPLFEFEKRVVSDMDIPKTGEMDKDLDGEADEEKIENHKVKVLQFTVIDNYGTVSGSIETISQKSFYKKMEGKEDISNEELGIVKILKK